jgi:ubiquinone/menaquinone biosynthesis C-methylase UbiE
MQKILINPSNYNETPTSLTDWLNTIQKDRISLYNEILHHIKPNSTAIEIGAGTAWLSSLCSQNNNIKHIDVIDINKRRLMLAQIFFANKLNANQNKMTFHISDFHKLDFIPSNTIDIIFVDAALHHTNTLDVLLKELYRILTNDGQIIAIREPILPSMPLLKQYKKMTFGKQQIKNGDIENIYSKDEWIAHFDNCGLNLSFHELYNKTRKDRLLKKYPLNLLNGFLFNRFYMTITKK